MLLGDDPFVVATFEELGKDLHVVVDAHVAARRSQLEWHTTLALP